MSELILGIDLGTSNSCAALHTGGRTEIVRNAQGDLTTPSVVAFGEDGALLVGAPARRQAIMNPTATFTEVKRLVGCRFDSPEVASIRDLLPYEVVRAQNGDAWVGAGGRSMSPPEVQAHVLEALVEAASSFAGRRIDRAVITVPAFFDETQRQAVRDAATIAGLEAARVLSEPTAAALAYGYAQLDDRHIAVVDLGGGTLDVTVMRVSGGRFQVLATAGDDRLGGADFDHAIARHLSRVLEEEHGIDVLADPVARQRLVSEAEQAKKILTAESTAPIRLPYLAQGPGGPIDLDRSLGRSEYEDTVAELVQRIVEPCRAAVRAAGVRASEIDDVLLVGGMSRSPVIQQQIGALFQRKPSLRVNPDEAVAIGASLLGASLAGELPEVTFVDVVPRTIGLRAAGDRYVPLIQADTPLPATATRRFQTTEDQQRRFELVVLQGEDEVASNNRRLARVAIEPIPAAPAGEVLLEVTFALDEHGALEVSAVESAGGARIRAPITAFSGLAASQVERLAAEHAARRGGAASEAEPAAEEVSGFSIDFADGSDEGGSDAAGTQPVALAGAAAGASAGEAAETEPTPARPPPASAGFPGPGAVADPTARLKKRLLVAAAVLIVVVATLVAFGGG